MPARRFALSALACLALLAIPAARADLVIVGNDPANPPTDAGAFPFGVGSLDPSTPATRYQQAYNAALFPAGPQTITGISFFDNIAPGGTFNPGTYSFSLSTTAVAVDALDPANFDANEGADRVLVATRTFSAADGPVGPEFAIALSTPFAYDPSRGNLLLDITVAGQGSGGFTGLAFDAHTGSFGTDSGSVSDFGDNTPNSGLVTQFRVEAVPEPASMALLGLGGAVVIGLARRRKSRTA